MSATASKWTTASIAIVLSLVGSIVGASWGAGQYAASVTEARQAIADHETRIRAVEKQAESAATDLRWIRIYLERAAKANGVKVDDID